MASGNANVVSSRDDGREDMLQQNSSIYYAVENGHSVKHDNEDLEAEQVVPKSCFCFSCSSGMISKGKHGLGAGKPNAKSKAGAVEEPRYLQQVQFPLTLLRQPTMTPVPEAKEVIINSREAEGENVNFHSMTEEDALWGNDSDTDTTTGSPDGSQSPLRKTNSIRLKMASRKNLKRQIGTMLRRLARIRPGGHILVSEPGDELELCTGSITPLELAKFSEFNGTWKLDNRASDSHDALCKAMKLGWTYRKAMDNSCFLKIECTVAEVMYTVQIPGLLNLVEHRPWSGEKVEHRRRDLQKGTMLGSVQRYSQGLVLKSDWVDPLEGSMKEYLQLFDEGQSMVVRLDLYRTGGIGHKEAHMRMIYHRITSSEKQQP